jgi:hypothetical protein
MAKRKFETRKDFYLQERKLQSILLVFKPSEAKNSISELANSLTATYFPLSERGAQQIKTGTHANWGVFRIPPFAKTLAQIKTTSISQQPRARCANHQGY